MASVCVFDGLVGILTFSTFGFYLVLFIWFVLTIALFHLLHCVAFFQNVQALSAYIKKASAVGPVRTGPVASIKSKFDTELYKIPPLI